MTPRKEKALQALLVCRTRREAAQSTTRSKTPLITSGNTAHSPMTGGALCFTHTLLLE